MKTKSFFYSFIWLIGSWIFLSCSNEIQIKENNDDIATVYFENKVLLNQYFQSERSVCTEQYPEFISELVIYNNEGKRIYFEELSDEDKESFYQTWRNDYINSIRNKIDEIPELLEVIEKDNEAIRNVIQSAERKIIKETPETLFYQYSKEIKKLYPDNNNYDRKANNKYILDENCVDGNSVLVLKNNYEKGLILATTNNGASSSSALVGHASIMHKDEWNEDWEELGLSKIFCTAWPTMSGQMTWDGKIDGVQEEPLAVWAGNKKCCIKNVYILRHRRIRNNANGNATYVAASIDDGNAAVEYALSKRNVQYSVVWHASLDYDDRFYCSKLVYKSYTSVSDEFKFPNYFWVTPGDIIANTNLVTSYSNNLFRD